MTLAFCSGIIFAGYFGHSTTSLVLTSNILRSLPNGTTSSSESLSPWKRLGPYKLSALVFLITIAFGASLYAVFVWRPVIDPLGCEVFGQVSQPYRFSYIAFADHEIVIEAELIGSVTYVPPQNYTGISLSVILAEAKPSSSATTLQVLSSDGFYATFTLGEVLNDPEIILIVDDGLRLVAKNYHGAYWVQKVVSLVIT
jgi:energy-coupling factor transport system substrate-specific component